MPEESPLRDPLAPAYAPWRGLHREADLANHLDLLEQRAGVRDHVDEVRRRPQLGLFGEDMLRQRIRRAYFGVRNRGLRLELIRTAYALDRRARFRASTEVSRSRLALERARARSNRSGWTTGLPVTVAALLPAFSGLDVLAQAAASLAILGAGWLLVRSRADAARRRFEDTLSRAAASAERARHVWHRPMLFTADEAAGGPESIEFGRQSCVIVVEARRAGVAPAARDIARAPFPSGAGGGEGSLNSRGDT